MSGWGFVPQDCRTEGCEEKVKGFGMSGRCPVHSILHDAAWLSVADLARVQEEIQAVTSVTPKVRRRVRRDHALGLIEIEARSSARYIDDARVNGATPAQVAAAQARGAAKAARA